MKELLLDFAEINALNKLLCKIKFESQMDGEDLDFFATSPIIISVFKKVNFSYQEYFKERLGDPSFELDEKFGIEDIKKRVDNFPTSHRKYIKTLNEEGLENYCEQIFAPFIPTQNQKKTLLNELIKINEEI